MIELEILEDMFSNMRAKTKWNVDGPMLWGYFFMDRSAEKLKRAATVLLAKGYHFVLIHESDDRTTHVLQMERAETHSPQTLFERNLSLYKLADELGLDIYDGMDVGPLPAQPN